MIKIRKKDKPPTIEELARLEGDRKSGPYRSRVEFGEAMVAAKTLEERIAALSLQPKLLLGGDHHFHDLNWRKSEWREYTKRNRLAAISNRVKAEMGVVHRYEQAENDAINSGLSASTKRAADVAAKMAEDVRVMELLREEPSANSDDTFSLVPPGSGDNSDNPGSSRALQDESVAA